MFAVLHSDINPHKSGLFYLTDQPYCKKSKSAKVKDGIINLFLRNYLIGRYNTHLNKSAIIQSDVRRSVAIYLPVLYNCKVIYKC